MSLLGTIGPRVPLFLPFPCASVVLELVYEILNLNAVAYNFRKVVSPHVPTSSEECSFSLRKKHSLHSRIGTRMTCAEKQLDAAITELLMSVPFTIPGRDV
ncbi:hypothetical protein NEUTE1DRAFT_53139 [Neurospora tetrasperma FGSC 2508]|uniref:Uncharacterized protein n=1 Tax=Neurospora tetrasperma (strain FGSC 2508 / ATCC MYA-4615 / P0657) TaxID=510951 RepID=F8N043_NEUT8|nr:uncharacterized protein NEUTE1DRAFT_53139 [Neurospora tetrasperma FGSC 2508]EGO53778.1 hypothetical protein NEUTE1DRAFT_53139 [Neurospora tetrasperma FGSC 2508]EGZ76140.1 hypothetical protein NEUTE2DRAFT_49684 [Neurospora tetrasperma FGSC 2509]